MRNSVTVCDRILDISVNLSRIANWAADSYEGKQRLIEFFLDQTGDYLSEVKESKVSKDFRPVLAMFALEFAKLKNRKFNNKVHMK